MIVVIDYGMGNLRSVSKALESLGAMVRVSSDPADVGKAEKVILPGVGAFPSAMRELTARGLIGAVQDALAAGTPYLGICLGLQLLFERSEEGEGAQGLGILPGAVRRFPQAEGLKIPHIGWNQVTTGQSVPLATHHSPRLTVDLGLTTQRRCPLLRGIAEGSFVYFVHSYYAEPADRSVVALEADYGVRFTAMVWRRNLFATQFHPEKSQAVGLRLLKNFVEL